MIKNNTNLLVHDRTFKGSLKFIQRKEGRKRWQSSSGLYEMAMHFEHQWNKDLSNLNNWVSTVTFSNIQYFLSTQIRK